MEQSCTSASVTKLRNGKPSTFMRALPRLIWLSGNANSVRQPSESVTPCGPECAS